MDALYWVRKLIVVAFAGCLCGCESDGKRSSADTEVVLDAVDDTEVDTGRQPLPEFECPMQMEECPSWEMSLTEIFNVAEFSENAEFVQVSGILPWMEMERPISRHHFELFIGGNRMVNEKTEPFLLWFGILDASWEDISEFADIELESFEESVALVALQYANDVPGGIMELVTSPIVAACGETNCFLMEDDSSISGLQLKKSEGTEFPIEFYPNDLYVAADGIHLIGVGEYRFDFENKHWDVVIPPEDGVTLSGKFDVATSTGEVLRSSEIDGSRTQIMQIDTPLNAAWKNVAVGNAGTFVYLDGNEPSLRVCNIGDKDFTHLAYGSYTDAEFFDEDGQRYMFTPRENTFCRAEKAPEPVIDSARQGCGDAENNLFLTAHSVLVTRLFCPIE